MYYTTKINRLTRRLTVTGTLKPLNSKTRWIVKENTFYHRKMEIQKYEKYK